MSSYRDTLDRWLHELEIKADTVIDIGGAQLPVKTRTRSWDVKNYLIADLDEPHVDSPQPDIIVDLNGYADCSQKADVIFCLEVFEYVYDPVNAMHILSRLLKPDGHIWATFMFNYPQHQPLSDDALRYTIEGVDKLAASAGLRIVHYQGRIPESDYLLQYNAAERLRAAKGLAHNIMGWIVKLEHV